MSTLAQNINEAAQATGEIRAGGTDYQARLRYGITQGDVVDISRLPDLDQVSVSGQGVQIGALVKIAAVADHQDLRTQYPGFSMAAGALATPQIRAAGTLGGSLLQRTRCWYYRHPDVSCHKKGGDSCPGREGNHKFGVVFDISPCSFPHPSTLGMVLMAYDAEVEIHGQGRRSVADLFGDGKDPAIDHTLKEGEVLSHVHLPAPTANEKASYFRSISRARAEWPLVEVIARYQVEGGKISQAWVAIGGVAHVPLRLPEVEAYLKGKEESEWVFSEAGKVASKGASPLPQTEYKVALVERTVFETLRRAKEGIWGGEG